MLAPLFDSCYWRRTRAPRQAPGPLMDLYWLLAALGPPLGATLLATISARVTAYATFAPWSLALSLGIAPTNLASSSRHWCWCWRCLAALFSSGPQKLAAELVLLKRGKIDTNLSARAHSLLPQRAANSISGRPGSNSWAAQAPQRAPPAAHCAAAARSGCAGARRPAAETPEWRTRHTRGGGTPITLFE